MSHPVLWVEDDADNILLIGRAMGKAGLGRPAIARDGREAVDYLSGAERFANRDAYPFPTFILMDLKLPKMTGLEVLQWIRAQPGIRRVPVIMFTSSQERSDIDRAYALGANAYLSKSVDHVRLVETLKSVRAFWMDLNLNPSTPVHESATTAPGMGLP
jgi:CheY-like chemotaxis protein